MANQAKNFAALYIKINAINGMNRTVMFVDALRDNNRHVRLIAIAESIYHAIGSILQCAVSSWGVDQ